MNGAVIAERAVACVGVPFRMHGRHPDEALDCVGLVGEAIRAVLPDLIIPTSYSLRGAFDATVASFFKSIPFRICDVSEANAPGDVLLVAPAVSQLHLLLWTQGGFVHAHAGLRRTVFTPGLPGWPIKARWRFVGE
jgi:hypothetical protein